MRCGWWEPDEESVKLREMLDLVMRALDHLAATPSGGNNVIEFPIVPRRRPLGHG